MTAPSIVATAGAPARRLSIAGILLPSIPDVLFVVLMAILFMSGEGWSHLLADGESGTHIRTGEFILANQSVPARDLYYFTRPETPWFAWEWLADVAFAGVHGALGLKGVVLFSGATICFAFLLLFRHMISRGAEVHIAAAITIVAADALRFHFLARPLIFTTLLAVISLWMLDSDWDRPRRTAWFLVPLAALWANLHGGFIVLLVGLGLHTAGAALLRDGRRFGRCAVLAAACSAATLVNPYGWQLHLHIWKYLRSDWLVKYVEEFQAPVFRGESMIKAEVLLFLGVMCVVELVRRRRYAEALLIVFWAHAALTSTRHLTVYAIAAAPAIADQLSRVWRRATSGRARGSALGALRDVAVDMRAPALRTSAWPLLVVLALALSKAGGAWPTDFPATFPTSLVARNLPRLTTSDVEAGGILSADIWGGYLAYRFYPSRRVFVDGRSDYFGPKVLEEYVTLRAAREGWEAICSRYHFRLALIPPDWALVQALAKHRDWRLVDKDGVAVLFEYQPNTVGHTERAKSRP